MRGWWNMACWEGLSAAQQVELISRGTLSLGYRPEGECREPATCCIETEEDAAPGPRFYCWGCAIAYLERLRDGTDQLPELPRISSRSDVSHSSVRGTVDT